MNRAKGHLFGSIAADRCRPPCPGTVIDLRAEVIGHPTDDLYERSLTLGLP
jgi:hypothetical protein